MEDIFTERFAKLNERQKEAVLTTDGPVMVVAGPGTGKTELLALRAAHIMREGLATSQSILCLTFTESACLNMRQRLTKFIGEDAYRVPIFTFHSFASYVMGRFPEYFWGEASFSLADDIVRAEILESLFKALPRGHPFASFHPSEGFVYLRDVKERMRHIKTGGYTAQEYALVTGALIKEYEGVNHSFSLWPEGRLGVKRLSEFEELVKSLESRTDTTSVLLAKALQSALMRAEEEGKTEALSDFKKKYLIADDVGNIVLKDFHNKEKLLALSEFYTLYENEMKKRGYYDFDDMILSVSHVLRDSATVRMTLEEDYQYIMIDEFQDTNEAQMDLVRQLTSSPYHEGRPNVLVVGDDDQAIYKFQGAEVSHLMRFREKLYRDVKTIVLDKNYRSTSEVLSVARKTILQGKERLENHFPDIQKDLTSQNKDLSKGEILVKLFGSDGEEYAYVARKIKELILSGVEANEIAVLARGHKELRALVPFLTRADIPHEYQKKANVFDEVHVRELIMLSEYLASFMEEERNKDYLAPEIFSFPFFSITRKSLFELSLRVKKEHMDWLTCASESADVHLAKTARFLIEMGAEAKTLPLLQFLKKLIEETPFKEFYFSKKRLTERPDEYVEFLTSLRTFLDAFALYKEGELLTAKDVAAFVSLHKAHDVPLTVDSLTVKKKESIKLMTAHASKGLEFSAVFILSASDSLWVKGRRGSKVPLPFPLRPLLEPVGDDEDDFLRLFYVALTRAKHSLFITAHESLIRFASPYASISPQGVEEVENSDEKSVTLESVLSLFTKPLEDDEKAILHKLVEGYKMPVTHLQNFCNVLEGGPLYFLEQNLLRFPQPMNASAVFGSAVHKVTEEMVKHKKFNAGESATLERLLAFFDAELAKGRLSAAEAKREKERGHLFLTRFYEKQNDFFLASDQVEVDFSKEGVVLDGAHLTGKIDFLREENGTFSVIDFKTGDSYKHWGEGDTDYEKLKLHKYRQQLITYELLLEGSHHFKGEVKSLALSFVEDEKSVHLVLDASVEEKEDVKKLIGAVYKKITSCDFPDISKYEKNFKGVLAFEKDLREGKI